MTVPPDNADCYYGDHTWRGGSVCVRCDARLRCSCGQFVREDSFDEHFKTCPFLERFRLDEADALAR